MRMKSCKEGVNDGREGKRDKEGKGAKKVFIKNIYGGKCKKRKWCKDEGKVGTVGRGAIM